MSVTQILGNYCFFCPHQFPSPANGEKCGEVKREKTAEASINTRFSR